MDTHSPLLPPDPDRTAIYSSRRKMALLLVGALAFVAIGIWIARGGSGERIAPWKAFVAVYVGIPFFGFCGLYASYRLLRPSPAVILDRAGITDRSTASGAGLIYWEEIDHILLHHYLHQPMLGIVLRDLDGFVERLGPMRRMSIKSSVGLGVPPVNIPQVSIDMPLAELAEVMRSRYRVRVERA